MAKNPQVLSLSCLLSSPGGEPCRNGGEPKAGSPPTLLPQLERKPRLLGLHCQKSSKIRALGELFATLPSRIFYIFITCCLQTSDNVGECRCYRWAVWNHGELLARERICGNNETCARSPFGFASAVYFPTEESCVYLIIQSLCREAPRARQCSGERGSCDFFP